MDDSELDGLVAWWEAANYLTVAQIYLRDNPLLREPLRAEHIKPRLLGHWGTSPALSLVYAQLNRLIRRTDAQLLNVTGPGHGGPAIVANAYLEGSWSEVYPEVGRDEAGLLRLVRQFSTPGGIPSHVSVPVPGSIHEGGELGYALVHAFGAAFDNPDLIVACTVGDGEAETGPLEGSWKGTRFLDPRRDGAVLPILNLNEAKISGPTVLGRVPDEDVHELLHAHGWAPVEIAGDDPREVHAQFAQALDTAYDTIRAIQAEARAGAHGRPASAAGPRWPALILRTPKGWTGPKVVDGKQVEGTFRAHQVPLANVRDNPDHLAQLETWMRSYRPHERFDEHGTLVPELARLAPTGDHRLGSTPHANGGRLLKALDLPDYGAYAIDVPAPATVTAESTRKLGELLRDLFSRTETSRDFRLFCPDETNSNRLGAVFEVAHRELEQARPDDEAVGPGGRVMEVLSEHLCQGWLEGYLLTGRHGMFATYEAFAMVSASMAIQHTKWLEAARGLEWRAPVASLNVLLTSTCWRNDHNGFSHQGPGLIDTMISMSGDVVRVYLPPDANCLLSTADHCLRSRDYVNLIVIDKQPELQYLTLEQAKAHCAAGAGIWEWAGSEHPGDEPDVVLACIGDVPTLETIAAAWLLRTHVPELRVRVVNVVDLMALSPPDVHPHGFDRDRFVALFGEQTEVITAFHGYARALHQLLHGRPGAPRFHVHGFAEQGTTTTPFDMVVLNEMSRYHLVLDALRRTRRVPAGSDALERYCETQLTRHHAYVREHLEDMPEVRDWVWTEPAPAA
ncbi:phosphoketolase family protein [Conexibacter stalactiti]|uniref:Phosphoketolase family protein n=1 Tax=Conexibacter stalactiti TaxID=1940611 RepID=A0ABU4HWB4_9ACTN|nr:phosphoketolase family protein [Conexibacter stalactiti]MDW5597523.1 phosphoketolase family protein [Conexibacter stalactiti]MEC5038165.1 phosphoketolase family protein [Conexibacter stalactiti]